MSEDRKHKQVTSVNTDSQTDTPSETTSSGATSSGTTSGETAGATAAEPVDTPAVDTAPAPVDTAPAPAPVDTAPAPVDTAPAPVDTAPAPVDTAPASQSYLRHVAIGLSVAALVFAVVVGWLAYGARADSAAEAARTEARVAAEEQAVAMLAYTHGEVDDQIAVAGEGLTGDFRDEYTNLMKNVIAPGAKEKAISVQVSVQGSSVVSADADSAVTLLFLNQITTSSENTEAVSSGSRVRVELEKHDGRWLVSRLTPI